MRHYILLIALAVIMTAIFCAFEFNGNNCYKVQYQQQGINKTTTVCEGTNK